MLKKTTKPSNNSLRCVDMMIQGAQKRRAMALAAINSLNPASSHSGKVVSIR